MDSISAIQVATRLRKEGFMLQASDVMESPTCSALASVMQSRSQTPAQSSPAFDLEAFDHRYRQLVLNSANVPEEKVQSVRPCTPVQSGMLSQYLHSGGQQYFNHTFYAVGGDIVVDKLKHAWSQVLARHEMLRTGFVSTDDSQNPFTMVTYKEFEIDELLMDNPSIIEQDAYKVCEQTASDSVKDNLHLPPWRWSLLTVDGSSCMQFSAHHAIFDAESLRMMMSDLRSILRESDVPARQGIDNALSHILASSCDKQDGQRTFWSRKLQGAPVSRFPSLTPLRSSVNEPAIIDHVLKLRRSEIEACCQRLGVSMQSVGQAAWARLLSAYTGETHVTFGVVFSGRTASETSDSPFPCITTLPVLSNAAVSDDQLLQDLMAYNAGIQKYQFTPMTDIQRYAELPNEALFDSLFVYQRPLSNAASEAPWEIVHEKASVEIAVSIEMEALPKDQLGFRLTIDPAHVPIEQGKIILQQMEEIIANLIGIKDRFDTSVLAIMPPKDAIIPTKFKYLHELAEVSAKEYPDRIAMEFVDSLENGQVSSRRWTYRQLDEEANKVAHLLLARGVQPGGIVATSFDKCPEASFAFFGILKAGCAFCAIDPTAPTARKAFILQDSNAKAMLTSASIQSELQDSTGCDIVDLTNLDNAESLSTDPVSIPELSPSSVSYVLYTSGTTGTPKGCELTHENAVQALMSFQRLFSGRWTEHSRWLQFASYHFDVSVLEQFWTWSIGIRMVCASRDLILEDIMGFIDTMQITHLDLTPSLGRLLDPAMVPSLHNGVFITGGESLKQDMINTWGDVGCLFNFYGPTECTIGVTVFPCVPKEGRPSNIGWQFDNVGSYILAPGTNTPVLRGAIGELCISGKLVGKGYLNRPELTKDCFPYLDDFGERVYRTGDLVRVLHDGSFDFLGRKDNQVKLRGQRLEIDEIEAVIRRCQDIQDTVCLVAKHPKQQKDQLIGFIGISGKRRQGKPMLCPAESTKHLIQMARTACEDHLPGYMVPTHFLPIERIPLSVNNKVEEKLLRQLYADMPATAIQSYAMQAEDQQDLSDAERKVAQVLADLLKIDVAVLKPTSNIFTLGLNSISAIQLSRKLKSTGFANAQVATVLKNSTISKLTKALSNSRSQADGEVADARQTISACHQRHLGTVTKVLRCKSHDIETIAPCTPLQQGIISRSLASDSSLYFNTFRYSAHRVDLSKLEAAFNEAMKRTQVLRTFFIETDDGYVQGVKKTGHLPWWTLEVYNLASVDEVFAKRKEKWRSYNTAHLTVPFEIVIVRSGSEVFLSVDMHHALYDGNSFDMLMGNVLKLYNSEEADFGKPFLESLPFGPLRNVQGAKEFWLDHLLGVEPVSMPGLIDQEASQDILCTSALEILEQADDLRRSLGVTVQALVQACWVVTLRKYYSGAVGTVVSGRSIDFDGVEKVIGPLFNTIPFYPRCESGDSWHTLVQRCHDFNTAALPYQHTALRDIMKWCRKGRSEPLFDTLFVFQGALGEPSADPSILIPLEDGHFEADYPLSFEAEESAGGTLKITVAAKSTICDMDKAQELIEEFHQAFRLMFQDPESNIGSSIGHVLAQPSKSVGDNDVDAQVNGVRDFDWTPEASAVRSEIAALAGVGEAEINEHISIFEVGLDSVDAVKLSSRLKKKGLALAVSTMMRSQNIASMVATLSTTKQNNPKAVSEDKYEQLESRLIAYAHTHIEDSEVVERIFPASPMQEALVSEMVKSNYKAYFNHDVLKIPSGVDVARLEQAWQTVVKASPILRTGFLEIEDPDLDVTFAQVVHRYKEPLFERVDLQSGAAVLEYLEDINDKVSSASLVLPQLRLTRVATSDGNYLVLSIAHALYDGHSLSLVHQDVHSAYNNTPKSRPFYDEVLKDVSSASSDEAVTFWRNLLAGAKKTQLPHTAGAGDKHVTHRAEKTSQLSSNNLTAFCKQQGVTLQAVCQTAWAFVLAHTVQSLDVMFGVVLAGRDSELAEEVMFPTMNTVVMRSVLHGCRRDVLQSIQSTIADISNHQHFPLRRIQAACQGQVGESSRGDAFFDALFTFQRRPDGQNTDSQTLYESVNGASEVEYPVAVEAEVVESSLVWRVACKSSVFDEEGVDSLLETLDNVLQEIVSRPQDSTLVFQDQAVSICGLSPFQQQAEPTGEKTPTASETPTDDADSWSDTETAVREIIAKVTKIPEDDISKTMSIQNLGVDSINAIKISALLRQKSLRITVSDIVRAGSIAKIAARINDKKVDATSKTTEVSADKAIAELIARKGFTAEQFGYEANSLEQILPATAGQVYMLGAWQATAGQIFFPEFEYKTAVPTTADAIKKAWEGLVSTHAILRTVFAATQDAEIPFLQLVLRDSAAAFVDLNKEPPSQELEQPFARLSVKKSGDGYDLRLKIHHALYDAVSLPLLIDALGLRLQNATSAAHPDISSPSLIARPLTATASLARKAFWTDYLRSTSNPQIAYTPSPSPAHIDTYDPRALDSIGTLESSLRKQGISLQSLFFAACARAYAYITDPSAADVVLGIYLANRSHDENLSSLAAPTLNLVPLRIRSPTSVSLVEVARQVQNDVQAIGSADNCGVGLWEIEAWTGVTVDFFVNFVKMPEGDGEAGEAAVAIDDEAEGKKMEKRACVAQNSGHGFVVPEELRRDGLGETYKVSGFATDPGARDQEANDSQRSLDVEATVADGALGIGVFGWQDMVDLEEAEGFIDELKVEIQGAIAS